MYKQQEYSIGKIKKVIPNLKGNITGFIIIDDDGEEYYSHVGDLKIMEDIIYKKRDEIQHEIQEGREVSFLPFKNNVGGRGTSVQIK